MSLRGVKYVSLHEASGYGIAARRAVLALRDAGVPVTWMPLVPGPGWGLAAEPFLGRPVDDPEMEALCGRPIDYDVVVVHMVPEYYPVVAAAEPGRRLVGSTVWETTRVPRHWPTLLARPDRLIVPCTWNREVFEAERVGTPVDVVPHPLTTAPLPKRRPWPGVGDDDFLFYTIGVWSERKAIGRTVEAFLRAFDADDPVALVVKTSPADAGRRFLPRLFGSTRRALDALRRRHRRPARVVLVTEALPEAAILSLHARGDCYVSLCRAEGWGLGAYDAARFDRPLIVTGFGGHLDFLPAAYPYRVDFELVPVPRRVATRSYSADQAWAEPSVEHGAQLMRSVFERRDEARRIGAELGRHVREQFAAPVVTARLLRALEQAAA